MKPTFSPWKPYLATIALFGAIVALWKAPVTQAL